MNKATIPESEFKNKPGCWYALEDWACCLDFPQHLASTDDSPISSFRNFNKKRVILLNSILSKILYTKQKHKKKLTEPSLYSWLLKHGTNMVLSKKSAALVEHPVTHRLQDQAKWTMIDELYITNQAMSFSSSPTPTLLLQSNGAKKVKLGQSGTRRTPWSNMT